MADARIATDVVEVLANGTSESRLANNSVEVLSTNLASESRLATNSVEVLSTNAASERRLATNYIEVLILTTEPAFIGWGAPI